MSVRTKLLAHGVATGTLTTVYTVPSGHTAIIKHITMYNPSGGPTTTFFARAVIAGANRGLMLLPGFTGNTLTYASELFIVLPPAAELQVNNTSGAAVQFMFSGAELEGVA